MRPSRILLCSFFVAVAGASLWPMLENGAIPDCSSVECAKHNGEVFYEAVMQANSGDTVLVEQGQNYFFIPPMASAATNGKINITIALSGRLVLHDEMSGQYTCRSTP